MALRASKPSFNVREKLTELGRRFGLKGSELVAAETVQEAREVVSAGRKNMIINGACTISERLGSGTYNLASSGIYFPVDRFKSWAGGTGAFTIQRSDNAPPGFKNSMMFTVSTADTSIASTEYYTVQQRIEGYNFAHLGWGTANAKPVTLSFWVKADIPGKYGISFWPNGQNYNYVTHYNINTVDTWEYKTITIPGATGGTWLTDNGTGFGIWWDFGVGTTYSTATTETWGQSGKFAPSDSLQMIKTNGAKFRMTGVQLEVGRNATDFEHRPYGEELNLCRRYFQKRSVREVQMHWVAPWTEYYGILQLNPPMRISPNDRSFGFNRVTNYQPGGGGGNSGTSIASSGLGDSCIKVSSESSRNGYDHIFINSTDTGSYDIYISAEL